MAIKQLYWSSNQNSFTSNTYSRTLSTEEKSKLLTGNNIIMTVQYYKTSGGSSSNVNISNLKICNTTETAITEIPNSIIQETFDGKNIITKSFSGTIGDTSVNNILSFTMSFASAHTVLNVSLYQGHSLMNKFITNSISDFKTYLRQNSSDYKWEIRTDSDTYEKLTLEGNLNSAISAHNSNANRHGVSNICGLSEAQTLTNKVYENAFIKDSITGTAIVTSATAGNSDSDTKIYSTRKVDALISAVSAGESVAEHNRATPIYPQIIHGISAGQGDVVATDKEQTLKNKDLSATGNKINNKSFTNFNTAIDTSELTIASNAKVKDYVDTHNVNANRHGVSNICGLTESQVLTNKTLTSPILNTGVSGSAIIVRDNITTTPTDSLLWSSLKSKTYVDDRTVTNKRSGMFQRRVDRSNVVERDLYDLIPNSISNIRYSMSDGLMEVKTIENDATVKLLELAGDPVSYSQWNQWDYLRNRKVFIINPLSPDYFKYLININLIIDEFYTGSFNVDTPGWVFIRMGFQALDGTYYFANYDQYAIAGCHPSLYSNYAQDKLAPVQQFVVGGQYLYKGSAHYNFNTIYDPSPSRATGIRITTGGALYSPNLIYIGVHTGQIHETANKIWDRIISEFNGSITAI